MFGHFSTLCNKGLKLEVGTVGPTIVNQKNK